MVVLEVVMDVSILHILITKVSFNIPIQSLGLFQSFKWSQTITIAIQKKIKISWFKEKWSNFRAISAIIL